MGDTINRQIKSVEELKQLSTNGLDCFIILNGGLRSSKNVFWDKDRSVFEIHNDIDGSGQTLFEDELHIETNIVTAIEQGALYYESKFLTKSEKIKRNKEYLVKSIIEKTIENQEDYVKSFIRKMMREALSRKTQIELKLILKNNLEQVIKVNTNGNKEAKEFASKHIANNKNTYFWCMQEGFENGVNSKISERIKVEFALEVLEELKQKSPFPNCVPHQYINNKITELKNSIK